MNGPTTRKWVIWYCIICLLGDTVNCSGSSKWHRTTGTYLTTPMTSIQCRSRFECISLCERSEGLPWNCGTAHYQKSTCKLYEEVGSKDDQTVDKNVPYWSIDLSVIGRIPIFRVHNASGIDVLKAWNGAPVSDVGQGLSPLIAQPGRWEQVKQVKVAMLTDGVEVMTTIFNVATSTKTNWFTQARIVSSMYTDITAPDHVTNRPTDFAVAGWNQLVLFQGKVERQCYAILAHTSCPTDHGWFMVVQGPGICDWEISPSYRPMFLYCSGTTVCNYIDAVEADTFMISALF